MIDRVKRFIRLNFLPPKDIADSLSMMKQSLVETRNSKRLFLFQTPTHTNIGDHAIAEAEVRFLKEYFPNYSIIEINQTLQAYFVRFLRKSVVNTDIVLLHGGGNLGNEYMREEHLRREVLQAFPHNKIVIFPQTIYYSDDKGGRKELAITQHIVSNCSSLILIARERISFALMKQYFPSTSILLTPDIVLSMNLQEHQSNRSGILMVLRSDAERILTDDFRKKLDELVREYSDKVTYSDMHYHKGIADQEGRDEVLEFKFSQFKSAQLVITDRLHGMVFAAITGAPCIAFSNYNQKVSGTYEWIKELNYISFVEDMEISKIRQEAERLLGLKENELSPFPKLNFQEIVKAIEGKV